MKKAIYNKNRNVPTAIQEKTYRKFKSLILNCCLSLKWNLIKYSG